ncbi:MAG: hypothetical protein MPK06_04815 [Alphaproteobacteria bacterium]|nr:hypothetical protein [Alphaproteobacteria bacterium]
MSRHKRLPRGEERAFPHTLSGHFLLGRWVSAEPATDLTALLDFELRSNLPAFDATRLLVTSLFVLRAIDVTSFRSVSNDTTILCSDQPFKNQPLESEILN